jgi:hypothetical protein
MTVISMTPKAELVGSMAQKDISETAGALEIAQRMEADCLDNVASHVTALRKAREELAEVQKVLVDAKVNHLNALEGIGG